jgi:hypothetical protein
LAEFPTFVNGSYTPANRITDQEDLMNLYLELSESQGASARASFLRIPGRETFATAIAVGGRGLFTDDQTGRCFALMGGSLVETLAGGTTVVRGTVAVDANPGTISTNGAAGQLLITSGSNAYSYDLATNTLALEVTGEATQGAVLYGFGLIFDRSTGRVRLSDLNDLTAWDPTQFFERSINTDPWQAMHVTPYGYIVLPGTQTGENWYNAGTSPIPFAPDPSGNFARGIAATFSIQQLGESVVWLSRGIEGDYTVVRMSGFTPQRISDHGIENDISQIGDDTGIDDAIGQVYGEGGHLFYLLTFPGGRRTWVYDSAISAQARPWAKRGTWIISESRYTYWRNVFHTFAFGKHLTTDPETAIISRLNNDLHTDVEDRPIVWYRRSPAIIDQHRRIVLDLFELLMEVGVGTQSGQGSDPVVMLRVSRDGGRTWGNQHTSKVGKVGEYWRRVYWRMLGIGRNWAFEVSGSDPVPYRITAAYFTARRTTEGQPLVA